MNAIASPAPMTAEEARASAETRKAEVLAAARAVFDLGHMVAPCDPSPRAPTCGVTSAPVPRDPPGMSHRVPPAPVEAVTVAHVLADLALCRAAVERMGRRVVSRERSPAPAPVALPVIPEPVEGANVVAMGPVDDYLPGRDEAVAWDDDTVSFCV